MDENFPLSAADHLIALGHDVLKVGSLAPGMSDREVALWAAREDRVILTSDKDFGEIKYRTGFTMQSGVILFRLPLAKGSGKWLADLVQSRDDWSGHFSVVTENQVRMRPIG